MVNVNNLYELAQYLESSALRERKTSLVIHAVNQDRNGNVERSEICNANVVGTITIETLVNLAREYPLLVARANEAQATAEPAKPAKKAKDEDYKPDRFTPVDEVEL